MLPLSPQTLITESLQLPLIPSVPSVRHEGREEGEGTQNRDSYPHVLTDPACIPVKDHCGPRNDKGDCPTCKQEDDEERPGKVNPASVLLGHQTASLPTAMFGWTPLDDLSLCNTKQ